MIQEVKEFEEKVKEKRRRMGLEEVWEREKVKERVNRLLASNSMPKLL